MQHAVIGKPNCCILHARVTDRMRHAPSLFLTALLALTAVGLASCGEAGHSARPADGGTSAGDVNRTTSDRYDCTCPCDGLVQCGTTCRLSWSSFDGGC
ncbi:MAG: hypothetical protein Q8N26_10405 [Myxococcales bacterium]|nr:hypothetical protein [Myxococcales bacterium]